jgi:membrane associated rhomboid family serine protease
MPILSRYYPRSYSEEQYQLEKRIFRHSLFVSGSFTVLLWLVKFYEVEFLLDFSTWGILPLSLAGLRGIICSPLIHANFEHLFANTLPIFILTFSLFFFYRKSAYIIFILIYLISGLFVWLVGRESWHIGASGVIYGLAGFLFMSGIISFNIRLLTISMVVALVYGGMFWGIFPNKPEISWESHLWGGISGLGLAFLYRKSSPSDRVVEEDEEIDEAKPEDDIESEQDQPGENN